MIPADLIKKLRRLEITTRRIVSETLAGQYHSVFKGRGMTFEEVRPYQPGDDVRSIDWNVTARMNEPWLKLYGEERELTVMLLVDLSASLHLGSREKSKEETAAEVAALLAFSAISNNDRVGLILFSDRIERFVPPKKGRTHAMRLIAEILQARPEGRGTDVGLALEHLMRVYKRRCVAFVISDFITPFDGFERSLKIAARRHDVIPVAVHDPLEESLPSVGIALIEDAETGERRHVDLSSSAVRAHFARAADEGRRATEARFKKLSLDPIAIRAGDPYVQSLLAFFHRRARRMAA